MSSLTLDFRNTNALWSSVLVETLARLGVRQAVTSPGSRCAPLTFAFARHPQIEAIPVLDERSAAFFALGLAQQHHRPVVLVCTSGTAAANYLPAIVEAHESGVPLLVLTADRPPELRDCRSGQTIDQQKLYGSFVQFYHELAVPEAKLELLRYLRQTVVHACQRTLQPEAGAVHLNCPFRDPLVPVEDDSARHLAKIIGEDFFSHLSPVAEALSLPRGTGSRSATNTVGLSAVMDRRYRKVIIVAGPEAVADPKRYASAVQRLAGALGWPVLADALSPVRSFPMKGVVRVSAYDAVLRSPKRARVLQPEMAICLGGWPTSKVLRGWLDQSGAEILFVAPTARNRDALHGRTRWITASIGDTGETPMPHGAADPRYAAAWRRADTAARHALDDAMAAASDLIEPKAAWLLAQHLPKGTPLFVANSMPVRDLEYFWPATDRCHRVYFNRGANGIDGTLSTALGVAHGGRAAVLLTGDLALLHDTNGFLLTPKLRGSLTIVLINNCGGGIFEHLPVAQFDPPFEEYFATPQAVDFARLCAAYGVEHTLMTDWAQFTAAVSRLPAQGLRVLEVHTDRKRDVVWRKKLLDGAAASK
jgi:2-succinyl-5-enolpyruvyl-6-hydroxy-3-cyclohexene-1-carboxylate synthase